jgi:protein-S-isoprenylcysteine O-methyltransferase Ste14
LVFIRRKAMELTRSRTGLLAGISVLVVVFTVALTFAALQLPVILGNWLSDYFPDIHPIMEPERVAEFMAVARPIGYACLGVIVVLIVAGIVTGKRKLSILGSLAFFLPTFGYFFASMFFLAGLGILRVLFIPFWDPSVNLMNFGDISYLPYMALVSPFWLGGIDIREIVAWVAMGVGLFIFVLGTITWFYGKSQRRKTIDFWIYRYSRHPQYLGFIVWSYGVMLFAAQQPVPMGGSNPGASLPWLLTALVIVWIALAEENKMRKEDNQAYLQYTTRAPFMFRVPKFVSTVVTFPVRLVLKKDRPETGKEILATFAVYATLLILLSSLFVFLDWPPGIGWSDWPGFIPDIPGPIMNL